MKEAAELPQH